MFHRRHYRKIAETLARFKRSADTELETGYSMGKTDEWYTIVNAMVSLFFADNPRFDRERFLTWCNTKVVQDV